MQLTLQAHTAFGLEAVVARELKGLGVENIISENGKLTWDTDIRGMIDAHLWLRCADRITLQIDTFQARDFDDLFDWIKTMRWERWITKTSKFPVNVKLNKSQINSVPNTQKIVKKAIVERLSQAYNMTQFPETGAVCAIECVIDKDQVTLGLNTCGAGLHKRGYRKLVGEAPLRETLAAALIQLSYWNKDRLLVDPFCGSGTILIEAAMIARNQAPGLNREFAAEAWPWIEKKEWLDARQSAGSKIEPITEKGLIAGYDEDPEAIRLSLYHLQQAGMSDLVHVQQRRFEDFSTQKKFGCVITNPPYGERLSEVEQVQKLTQIMGRKLRELETWSIYIISALEDFETYYGKPADRRRKLYNGPIPCTYYQYAGPKPPRENQPAPVVLSE